MITLYRNSDSPEADAIEEAMQEMVLAYRVEEGKPEALPDGASLPAIREGDRVISEPEKLEAYLRDLQQELNIQRSVTGDACYIDPDTGETC